MGLDNSSPIYPERQCTKRLLYSLKHIQVLMSKFGLFTFFIVYTLGGAKVFEMLESPHEVKQHGNASTELKEARNILLYHINATSISPQEEQELLEHLRQYEETIDEAQSMGIKILIDEDSHHFRWSFIESIFFASTVITTIGYGNMAPKTTGGRFFCIFYGFIGIPVTVSVIADLGNLLANALSTLWKKIRPYFARRHFQMTNLQKANEKTKRGVIVLGFVIAFLIYLSIGACLFCSWENWSFFESFYFCFITMTTVGLGDFVPERTEYMLFCTLYILVGLALTSTIIELVRRQYAESWEHMKELSGRLGDLSGPLAEQLRKIANYNIDLHINSDLKDLISTIQVMRVDSSDRTGSKPKQESLLADFIRFQIERAHQENSTKRKVIQIIVYETSL